jgi:hypothetical protein
MYHEDQTSVVDGDIRSFMPMSYASQENKGIVSNGTSTWDLIELQILSW